MHTMIKTQRHSKLRMALRFLNNFLKVNPHFMLTASTSETNPLFLVN